MVTRRWQSVLLVFITLVAFASRWWWLDRAPKGALIDEAHYGYIAYSLAQTGKDEHGVSYPVIFKGFGDQKLPVYGYLLVPLVKWFGLSTTVVRLPSVVAGTLLVPVMYWFLLTLGMSGELALVGALLTAFSPWTFILSRFAFESNVALLFFTVGLISLLKGFKHHATAWFALTAVLWALTWYTYVAYRPVTLGLAFLCCGFAVIKKRVSIKSAGVFFLLFGALIAPLFQPAIAQSGTARFQQVGIFNDEGTALEVNDNRTYCNAQLPAVGCYALWNKGTVIGSTLLTRFLHVYSPQFMATDGDTQLRYLSPENTGQLLLVVYPLLLLGLVAVLFYIEDAQLSDVTRWLLVVGLVVAPIPAILAGEPQKVRLSVLVPFVIAICVLGWKVLLELVPHQLIRKILIVGSMVLFGLGTISFLINFYTIHTIKYDLAYQSYLPAMFSSLESLKTSGTRIFIKPFFSDPIMAYAYYTHIDPSHYQVNVVLGKLEASGFQHAVKLDAYEVSDDPLINIGCKAVADNYQAIFVTNENFKAAPKLANYTSTTGAVDYAFAYDAKAYAEHHPEQCH